MFPTAPNHPIWTAPSSWLPVRLALSILSSNILTSCPLAPILPSCSKSATNGITPATAMLYASQNRPRIPVTLHLPIRSHLYPTAAFIRRRSSFNLGTSRKPEVCQSNCFIRTIIIMRSPSNIRLLKTSVCSRARWVGAAQFCLRFSPSNILETLPWSILSAVLDSMPPVIARYGSCFPTLIWRQAR
uniref:Uncharacterized protein n=1 Tax=Cacopsylla melanoneura TaxID=428564 RepID=A0A8D8YKX5_9HEMI